MRYRELPRLPNVLQQPVTADELSALCRRMLGPQTRLIAARRLNGGHFNTCYHLQFAKRTPLVLRLAPPETAHIFRHERGMLARECNVQPLLTATSKVFPEVVAVDISGTVVRRDAVLQNCLDGELWSNAMPRISFRENIDLWRQLGDQVRRIHEIPGDSFGFPAPFKPHCHYSEFLYEWIDGLADDLVECGLRVSDLARFRSVLRAGEAIIDAVTVPRLVHGDLWPRNILVARFAEGWRITGILDSERAFWGDPAAEWIFSFLEIPDAFWRAYGRNYSLPLLGIGQKFRRCCYDARGALQLILDGKRHGYAAEFAYGNFASSVALAESLLDFRSSTPDKSRRPNFSKEFPNAYQFN